MSKELATISRVKREQFLEVLAAVGNRSSAAAASGLAPSTIRNYASKDPEFKEMVEIAELKYLSDLEQEARRRAVDGVDKPVFYRGEIVGHEKVYSDRLLDKLMTGADKGRYGTGNNTTNNNLVVTDEKNVAGILGKFLGVDLSKPIEASSAAPDEDIIEGEYVDSPDS